MHHTESDVKKYVTRKSGVWTGYFECYLFLVLRLVFIIFFLLCLILVYLKVNIILYLTKSNIMY